MKKVIPLRIKNRQVPLMDVLHRLMDQRKLNMSQLGKNTGLGSTTIKKLCTDPECNPTLTSLTKVANFFGITLNQLIGIEPLTEENIGYYPDFETWTRVPIIDMVQVIDWPNNSNDVKQSPDTQYVRTDLDTNENVFAVIAPDEALEPKFSQGTILILDPARLPSNKDYILLLNTDKALPQFRQILIDGPEIYCKTINPELCEGSPVKLVKSKSNILGVLIQAKSNYI